MSAFDFMGWCDGAFGLRCHDRALGKADSLLGLAVSACLRSTLSHVGVSALVSEEERARVHSA